SSLAINPYERNVDNISDDNQEFEVVSTLVTDLFRVVLTGLGQTGDLSTSNDPRVSWAIGTDRSGGCHSTLSRSDTDPNDYRCRTTALLQVPVHIDLAGYNQVLEKDGASPCGSGL